MAKSENKNWTQKKFLEEKILLDWIKYNKIFLTLEYFKYDNYL